MFSVAIGFLLKPQGHDIYENKVDAVRRIKEETEVDATEGPIARKQEFLVLKDSFFMMQTVVNIFGLIKWL